MAFGINIPVGFKLNPAGLHKARKEFEGFGKSIKGALGLAGIAVGLESTINFVKESVKQAQEDILSQKMLARQLRVTIHATKGQIAAQEDYISKLSLSVGIVDDRLRPAYATLLRVTGNAKKAQQLLNISLDTSAGTGKNLEIVTKSVGRAYLGNLSGLQKLVPGIKKGSDAMAFLKKNFKDARSTLASPFDRMQVAVDELKEKFGKLLLPMVTKFVDYLTIKVVPAVSAFLDQVANPKTDVGKTFMDIKKAVKDSFQAVSDFFALFGNGDAMKGFGNIVKSLVQALPALLALKSIMVLANGTKTIANLITAMVAIAGKKSGDGLPTVLGGGKTKITGRAPLPMAGILGVAALVLSLSGDTQQGGRIPANRKGFFNYPSGNPTNIVVNAYGSTPTEFGNLIAEAINRHNRLNGKK